MTFKCASHAVLICAYIVTLGHVGGMVIVHVYGGAVHTVVVAVMGCVSGIVTVHVYIVPLGCVCKKGALVVQSWGA